MKLYFARHGHTNANANSQIDPMSGEIDEPLNQEGIIQASDLAEELKGVRFDVIIASPRKRTYRTAEIINKYHNMSIEVDPDWREREVGGHTDLETWIKLFDFNQNFSLENSEPIKDFFSRVYDAIDELKRNYSEKTVLLVSHGGVHSAVYTYANKSPLEGDMRSSPMRNCEYRIYEL